MLAHGSCAPNSVGETPRISALLTSLFLLMVFIVSDVATADSWAAPTTFEVTSENGLYVAEIWIGDFGSKERPALTVMKANNGKRKILWACDLSNDVAPVRAMISNDGKYVVTLDNWHGVGYGDDVLAFYDSQGQIMEYSLEEALLPALPQSESKAMWRLFTHSVSSRFWRTGSLMFFDESGDSTEFGIWLDWAQQWLVWTLANGESVDLDRRRAERWNEKGRNWAVEMLQLPSLALNPPREDLRERNEKAREWSRRKSARYGAKIKACRYLAYLKNPDDRPLVEQAMASSERNANWDMDLRQNADRALAIYDGKATRFWSDRFSKDDQLYFHGEIALSIRLPYTPTKGEGQVYVSVYSEEVRAEQWPTAKPIYRTGKSFKRGSAELEEGALKLTLGPMRTGRYWVKAVWDRTPHFQYDLHTYEGMREWVDSIEPDPVPEWGDFESVGAEVFAVRAGETTSVMIDCKASGS